LTQPCQTVTVSAVGNGQLFGGPRRIRWPDSKVGPWSITIHWAEIGGRLECLGVEMWSGIEIDSKVPKEASYRTIAEAALRPIGTAALREVPISQIIEADRRLLAEVYSAAIKRSRELGGEDQAEQFEQLAALAEGGGSSRRGRPRTLGIERFQRVAQIYDDAWRRSEHPTMAVAERETVSYSTAAKWVARCRQMGLLPETTKGRPAGGSNPPPKRKRKQ
jgi:hypothetical protein